MGTVTICSDFGAPQNKVSHSFHCFPIYLLLVMGPDAMILVFWMLSFKPTFTFIKKLFSSSSLSAIRVVSSAYLKLLTFLLAILIPACESFSPAFHMMDTASKLNKQGDNIQPWQSQPHPQSPQNLSPFLGRRPSQVTTSYRPSSERSSETGGATQQERAVRQNTWGGSGGWPLRMLPRRREQQLSPSLGSPPWPL